MIEYKYPDLAKMTKREQYNLLIAALEENANAIERNNLLIRSLLEEKNNKRAIRKSRQAI